MKVWVTRAEPGAQRTAERVRALGHDPCVLPLLQVRALPGAVELAGVGALAFTSANGVRAFAERCPDRGLPVFSVGDATAAAALGAGFRSVSSADGDVAALARLVAGARDRIAGVVLAPGGLETAGDLIGALNAAGIQARAQAVYETVAADAPGLADILPTLGAVLIHSPKAAARVAEVLAGRETSALLACCISAAAAQPLSALRLKSVTVAPSPNETSLLDGLPPKD